MVPQNRSVPVWGDKGDMAWTGALEATVNTVHYYRQHGRADVGTRVQFSALISLLLAMKLHLYTPQFLSTKREQSLYLPDEDAKGSGI